MAQRIPIPGISGALSAVPGAEAEIHIPDADALTGLFFNLERAPEAGASATVEIRTASGGGGQAESVVFPAGARAATWVGSRDVSGLSSLWQRLAAITGSEALRLTGVIELDGGDWLTTLEHVRELYGRSFSATPLSASELDALAARKISSVSDRIRGFTHRHLTRETITGERHHHRGRSPILQVDAYPLVSVQAVRVGGDALVAGDDYDPGPFTLRNREARRGHLVRLGSDGRPRDWEASEDLEVDYTAGFDPVPQDLAEAAALQVAWELSRTPAAGNRHGVRSTVEGEATATYMVDPWSPDALEMIRPYRQPVVG